MNGNVMPKGTTPSESIDTMASCESTCLRRSLSRLAPCVGVFAVVGFIAWPAATNSAIAKSPRTSNVSPDRASRDDRAASAEVDSLLEAAWSNAKLQPAESCTDDEFLRRVTLDLAGRIPTVDEVRDFRKKPDRIATIDRLLSSPNFSRWWSELWTSALVGYGDSFGADREAFRRWMEGSLERDEPFDELARRMIAAEGSSATDGATNFLIRHREEPVVKVTQLFLGVRLDCARCHDHPFDRWTQDDYRDMSSFFSVMQIREVSGNTFSLANRLPGAGAPSPRFLTGAEPSTGRWRDELALFTVRSKPFARAYANRIWYWLVGRGIVDPPDDFRGRDSAVMPELLDALAASAIDDRFDLRTMIRRICQSRAYQVSSRRTATEPDETTEARRRMFLVRTLKPVLPEQTYASACVVLQIEPDARARRQFVRAAVGESPDGDFSRTWEFRESTQSMLEQLARTVPVAEDSVEQLFLRALTREPTEREREFCRRRSSEEIVFALLHGNEFAFCR